MIKRLIPLSIIVFLALVWPARFEAQEFKISTEEELKADVVQGPCKNDERLDAVKTLFQRMGAQEADIKVEKLGDVQNVIVRTKGKTDETVIIGAHYDKVSAGCGLIDNWSGVVILAHIYRTVKSSQTEKSYVFVAFDKEEIGLRGSGAMAKAIPKEDRVKYCSMVNLDSFGLGYPVVLENASSSSMVKFAKKLAQELKVPFTALNVQGANSDSSSFRDREIPAITLSALSNNWPQYLHSSSDKMENVNHGSVRIGYNFGLHFLVKIDSGACQMFRAV